MIKTESVSILLSESDHKRIRTLERRRYNIKMVLESFNPDEHENDVWEHEHLKTSEGVGSEIIGLLEDLDFKVRFLKVVIDEEE